MSEKQGQQQDIGRAAASHLKNNEIYQQDEGSEDDRKPEPPQDGQQRGGNTLAERKQQNGRQFCSTRTGKAEGGKRLIKQMSIVILLALFADASSVNAQKGQDLVMTLSKTLSSRFLQVTCPNANQFANSSNRCVDCNAACATCIGPTGSCERCQFNLPTITFAMQNQISFGSGASCATHQLKCQYRDPFCMDECPNTQNGGKCNSCLKGTMITPIQDPQALPSAVNQNSYQCKACSVPQCTNCMLTTVNGVETTNCTECERNFALSTDNSTGTPIQRCVRSSTFCPNFCICDFGGTMNCTRCNDTNYVVVKEAGISNFGRCVRSDLAPTANIDCGPRCTNCNSLTGTCLDCEAGYAPAYDTTSFPGTTIRFTCQPICGPGCLSCNEATRSCMQCDELKNFTQFTIDPVSKTFRCYDITYMCDEACINCNTRGLQNNPYSTVGICLQCKTGYYVNSQGRCDPCPNLCNTCAAVTGSCFDCTNIKYTLYRNTAQQRSLCTDKVCNSACLSCSIEEGMNAIGRPYCKKCSQGNYLTNDFDCRLCPLNCGSCDDGTGLCNQCKPGFSLNIKDGTPLCISDSTVGVCTVPNCATCDAQKNTTCAICDPGYDLDPVTTQCPCKITLGFKSRFFTADWLNIQIIWNGRVQAKSPISSNDPISFCDILTTQTLVDISQSTMFHQCFLKYDIQSKKTTFTLKLNPAWSIPNDGTSSRNPTTKISFDVNKLETPFCTAALDSTQFTQLSLAAGDASNPTVIISRTMSEVPLCTSALKISSGLTQGLFGRSATYVWSISSMSPLDSSNAAKIASLSQALNKAPVTNDVTLDSNVIRLLTGKTITLKLDITNFLSKTGSAFVDFIFLGAQGLILENVMEEYVINPYNDYDLAPQIGLSACNFSADTVNKISRYAVQCSIEYRDPITTQWIPISIVQNCIIPSGMMSFGRTYRVSFVGYDPSREFTRNATKQSPIKLVMPPIIAKIVGGDQIIDSNKDLTLAVRGENLGKELSYKWSCKNPTTGLQCVDLYGNYLYLSGTDSVFIKANILALGTDYQINFAAADQMDVSRIATDFVTISTLPSGQKLLQISIHSDANRLNNQLNIYEKQAFKAIVLNEFRNPIANLAQFTFQWSVYDSMGIVFTQFSAFMGSMTIQSGYLQPNNIYQVCVSVQNTTTKQLGAACTKYKSNGDSNIFSFTVNPTSGNAFTTPFDFTAANTQSLRQQYFYEFGFVQYTLNAQNQAIDASYIPFEVESPTSVKSFRLQPPQAALGTTVKTYAKITGENGERFIYFRDITVNLLTQNATFIGDTINQAQFTSLNAIFTKVTQVALVSANIEARYRANVIRTLVEGISNITNMTLGYAPVNQTVDQSLLTQPVSEDIITQRIAIVKSLSQVTNLIRADPEIISQQSKQQMKNMLNAMIGLDQADNVLIPDAQNDNNVKVDANATLKEKQILSTNSISKDKGQQQVMVVEKFDQVTAIELLKICDDIFTAETLSNKTDPELKKMAVQGIKKIISGSINEITNTFTFETPTIKAQSQLYIAGKDSTKSGSFQISDPMNSQVKASILLPAFDLCGGSTCQMNLITMKGSPITNTTNRLVGSTLSISFQKRSPINENKLMIEQMDFNTLASPITFKMTLDQTKINQFAQQRCVYFDTTTNTISDQGILTNYNSSTGEIQCDTFHLTDFSIMETDPGPQPLTTTMPPNINKVEIFQPLSLMSTTPCIIMIIFSVVIAVLVPIAVITDRIMESNQKSEELKENVQIAMVGAEKAAADNETTLADVMFFNKYEERSKPQYAIANDSETKADEITMSQMMEEYDNEEEDDDAYNILKRKLKIQEALKKKKEAMVKNQARGTYSLFFMLCLAIRYQHRIVQLFLVFDLSLSRHSRAWILICSQFISLVVCGIYCQPDAKGNTQSTLGVIVALVVQKVIITVLNLLMVKLPKNKKQKIEDAELGLNRNPNADKKKNEPKYKEYVSYKMSPCDKMAFSFGFFLIFAIIAGSVFFSMMQSQAINSTENTTWLGMYFTLIVLDFAIFEFICIFISISLLKKVGSHPTALGRLRNLVIKYGPRAIRSAKVTHGEEPKKPESKKKSDKKSKAESGPDGKKKSSKKEKKPDGATPTPNEATKDSTAAAKKTENEPTNKKKKKPQLEMEEME